MTFESDQTNELVSALSKAQAEFGIIPESRTVDFTYNGKRTFYKYADLSDVIEVIKGPLGKHGLSHTEQLFPIEGKMCLTAKLRHSSGQWISSVFPITLGSKPQESGSAITYARRYTLSALLGIQAEEDNDGATATEIEKRQGNPDKESDFQNSPSTVISPITSVAKPTRQQEIIDLAKKIGKSENDIIAWCNKKFHAFTDFDNLTKDEYQVLILSLQKAK